MAVPTIRDANNRVVSDERFANQVEKLIIFDGSAGNGATGTVNVFTVTGSVVCRLLAVCEEDLAGATATIAAGVAGDTGEFVPQTTATDIDNGEIWQDATPDTPIEASSVLAEKIIGGGADIILTVATANITGGKIRFMLFWYPLSADGNVAAA